MSASAQVDMVSRWKFDNSELLGAEMMRLRLLLRRRSLWLRSQWSHESAQDYLACKISDAQADWLLGGEDRESEAEFYRTDIEALQLAASLQRLEDSIAERSQAMRDAGMPASLDVLQHLFALGRFERDVLLLVIAPHLDPSFERLYAYLQDDVTCRYPTPHLALGLLAGDDEELYRARETLLPDGTLRRYRLIAADEEGQPNIFANRALRTDERILNFLLGANRPDEQLRSLLDEVPAALLAANDREQVARVVTWLQKGRGQPLMRTVNFVGDSAAGFRNLARATCDALGVGLLELKAANLPAAPADRHEMFSLLEREAVLMHSAFYCDLDLARAEDKPRLTNELDTLRVLLMVGGAAPWQGERETMAITVAKPGPAEQAELWKQSLLSAGITPNGQIDSLTEQFDFTADHISRAIASARTAGAMSEEDGELSEERLWQACAQQAAPTLDERAQRIPPCYDWEDLVLPPGPFQQLQEIAAQVAHRAKVYGGWGFGKKLNRGRGISALFAGASGTGKTMAAEVLARHLHLDLYRIDLAGVVSKYIGETEKNLRSVFDAAERGGAILFFDEADALFGKRSEVKDSHDRYANIEVNYLLQRMEDYRGLAILATNRKSALDSAFLRRLRFIVDFPFPDAVHRLRIWRSVFPEQAEVDDVDFAALARLEIAGGYIRNIALAAAFLAASEGQAIAMSHMMRAARREYTKMDRVIEESDFGVHHEAAR
jgi:hypothetical protein